MYTRKHFKTINSTNQYLKDNFRHYEEYTVITSDKQTQGKGRFQRKWEMKKKKHIALSILLKPTITFKEISLISLLTAVSVLATIQKYVPQARIKWPNDIIVNEKKISGILIESVSSTFIEAIIVGVGINVNGKSFPKELRSKATSIEIETQQTQKLDNLIDEFILIFDYYYQSFLRGNRRFIDTYRKNTLIIGQQISIDHRLVTVNNILDNGNLLIQDGNQSYEIGYGEISLEHTYQKLMRKI